ncbi:MAG: TIGR01777 family protein [Candidatus Aminicenantes bacterium]|nr:TIGR01777 family protein [Candidatus Aminicenantes bacterium]
MHVIILGATGFIGRALSQSLVEEGYEVVALSRNQIRGREILGDQVKIVEWDSKSAEGWASHVNGAYAIVNLVGENLSSGRWTQERKKSILESRLKAGKAVNMAIQLAQSKPKVVIQASAIGYYGSRSDEILDESSPPGEGFLSEVTVKWEDSTKEVESQVRRVIIRTGLVLGRGGGILSRLVRPFRFFLGGPPGSGKQWFSWIHLDDEVSAIRFLMEREDLQGAFNLTAPEQLMIKDFYHILGKAMRRPSWLPIPGFVLRLLYGEMAQETILSGQRVVPKRLLEAGYKFIYPQAGEAIKEILG